MNVIAIDGPAGAGKSTVAAAVADVLGYTFLDTGSLYRAMALAAIEADVPPDSEDDLRALAASIEVTVEDGRVLLGGRDVSARIRDDDVTARVSSVAASPSVRAALAQIQRAAAATGEVVIEGRDIGTVVAPGATLKVYLTASLGERARRRALQTGRRDDEGTIVTEIAERDRADATRDVSPLLKAPDAVVVDSTDRSIDDVVAEIVRLARAART